MKEGVKTQRITPPTLGIWPYNNYSHIWNYLFIISQAPPVNMKWDCKRSTPSNNKPPTPINIFGQSIVGVKLCNGFCQLNILMKHVKARSFYWACWANFLISYTTCATC